MNRERSVAARNRGSIVWLTGLSGAGKSTLAKRVQRRLEPYLAVEVLDGDVVRRHLCRDLGFSKDDRDANVLRIGYVARLLARHGVVVIVAAISPYAQTRDKIRTNALEEGVRFFEVLVHAELDVLIARDVKGLYRKALAGQIPNFTGVSDPYEPPVRPNVVVHTDRETIEQSEARIVALLDPQKWGLHDRLARPPILSPLRQLEAGRDTSDSRERRRRSCVSANEPYLSTYEDTQTTSVASHTSPRGPGRQDRSDLRRPTK